MNDLTIESLVKACVSGFKQSTRLDKEIDLPYLLNKFAGSTDGRVRSLLYQLEELHLIVFRGRFSIKPLVRIFKWTPSHEITINPKEFTLLDTAKDFKLLNCKPIHRNGVHPTLEARSPLPSKREGKKT